MNSSIRQILLRASHLLRLVAGLWLLAAFSWEILHGEHPRLSPAYLSMQLVVCLLFMGDFMIRWLFAERRDAFLRANWLYLLLSIPWLNLIDWSGVALTRPWAMVVGLLPILVLVLAVHILLSWIDERKIHRLFITYLVGAMLFTYLSALIFYDFEGAHSGLPDNFGDALWWAGMSLSTAGAPITPATAVGKVLSVLLPMAGMLFLPIFTTYIMERYNHRK
ncbi:MAG: potassium channel family protein [Rikenellaceae bacterium]|nr:potassium channel family protein [Rikenellaceae bacterium]